MSEQIYERKIRFEQGIPGFTEYKEYVLFQMEEGSPFSYLQSAELEELSFLVVNPFLFFPNYEFKLPDEVQNRLEINSPEHVMILNLVTIGEEAASATANLLAPVIINVQNLKAEQVVLDSGDYTTKHPLFSKVESTTEAVGGK